MGGKSMRTLRVILPIIAVVITGVHVSAASSLAPLSSDSVQVSLSPDTTTTIPDSTFKVFIALDSEGPAVNGYETVIRWDPTMLRFLSAQPESLMSQYNQWWVIQVGPDSISISHVIMQSDVTITGPGALSSIRFQALQLGETTVTFQHIDFYRFGFIIPSHITHDAVVRILDAASGLIGPHAPQAQEVRIQVQPNPITSSSVIRFELPAAARGVLRIRDVLGRTRGEAAVAPIGNSQWRFLRIRALLDASRIPEGVYFLDLSTDRGTATTRLVYAGFQAAR
jgi:hypothetical protein